MSTDFDVIIIGGGLVGLSLACLLVKQNYRVAIVESENIAPPPLEADTYQLRVSAINLASQEMFSKLGVWDKITATERLAPYERMFVWDSLGRGQIHFDCTQIAESSLGYIVENTVIYQALLQELSQYREVVFFANRQPIEISFTQENIQLSLSALQQSSKKELITAELLVGADGALSWVREYTKLDCYQWPYHHEALVTTVTTEQSHQKTAWQCFLRDGPLALLPLCSENHCSIVWSAPPHEINRLKQLEETEFNREITNAFEFKLGHLKRISRFASFPLNMRHAKRYVAQRVALAGDAAHTIHPLAGQGINLGFADVTCMAKHILEAKSKFNDCGNHSFLRRYERERKSDNWIMILGMEFFKRLFENQSQIAVSLRSIGLDFIDKSNFIKNQFVYKAIGR
jgi:2-polyprenylphenol 6-hydroxylase